MKLNIFVSLVLSLLVASSCSFIKGKKKNSSSTTGWSYNDPKNGGFEYRSGYSQKAGPGLVYIQGGTFTMGRVQQDVMFDGNNTPRRVTVASFYMDECEVRNVDWREYLYWLQRVYPNDREVYQAALPDTLLSRAKNRRSDAVRWLPVAQRAPALRFLFRERARPASPVRPRKL